MGRKSATLCACGNGPVEPQFGTCIDCFARAAVVYEAFTQIARDHGPLQAMAARPILEKCIDTGWQEAYREEYLTNLDMQIARAEQEAQTKGK